MRTTALAGLLVLAAGATPAGAEELYRLRIGGEGGRAAVDFCLPREQVGETTILIAEMDGGGANLFNFNLQDAGNGRLALVWAPSPDDAPPPLTDPDAYQTIMLDSARGISVANLPLGRTEGEKAFDLPGEDFDLVRLVGPEDPAERHPSDRFYLAPAGRDLKGRHWLSCSEGQAYSYLYPELAGGSRTDVEEKGH